MSTIAVFERGDTLQFIWESSVAPDAAPLFSVTEPFSKTAVHSATSLQSATTAYYAFFTMPLSLGTYLFEWKAVKTLQGSAYNFIDRGTFRVEQTRLP